MENIEANLKRYRDLVVSHLKATDIILKLPVGIITIAKRIELSQLAATSQAQATENILDILDKSTEPGKWQAFSEALHSADYPYLLEILKSTPKSGKHEDYYLKLIHVFANELQKCVVPMHILPYLLSKSVISQGDVQEITTRQLNVGPQLAFLLLLDLLPRRQRPEIWYRHFLEGLLEQGHEDLVQEIDPDYFSTQNLGPITEGKVKQGYTSSGASWAVCHSDREEMECVMEDIVEPEHDSMGDQGAPSPSNPESCDMMYQPEETYDQESSPIVSSSSSLTSSKRQASYCEPCDSFTQMKVVHSRDFRIAKDGSGEIDTTNKMDNQIKFDITSTNKLDMQSEKKMVYTPNVSVEHNSDESEDENFMTSDYDDEEGEEPPKEKITRQDPLLQLRNYQIELAKIAVGGENTIICAPTGSGKTWVALHIIKKHLEAKRPREKRTVAFMAKTNPLIKQQYRRCTKYLPQYRTSLVTGDTEESTHLDAFLPVSDILCFTPQILVNNLESKSVKSLSEFTLLIVDECHHTKKEDAYNKLMRKYLMDLERKNIKNLPQVVGLTASVGAGKSSTVDEAVNYILGIMANMDVYKLSTVQKYREELEKHVSVPKEVVIPMVTGVNGESQGMIEDIMMKIEEELQDPCLFEPALNLLLSDKPSDYKAQNYMQWVRTLEKTTSTVVTDPNTARHILACARYLVILSAALEMNSLLTVQDVMTFFSTSLKPISQHQEKQTEEEKKLFQLLKGLLQDLNRCHRNNAHNPNLVKMRDTLEEMLLAEIKERKSPRALVFVKTRATCLALARFMGKEMAKKGIKVHYLTGKSAKEGDDGMTEAEQTDALNKFEQGHYLVLVSTSVGSEGIDIPDCNIVLSYDYAGNEITKIQMTGRGRQKNSTKIALASETVIKQETVSAYRAAMMYKAIDKLKLMNEHENCGKIREIQREQLIKQEIREKNAQKKESMKKEGDFTLQCIKCSVPVVSNDYIKCVKNSHHVVTDKKFFDKIEEKSHPKPKKIEGIEVKKMIFCKNCGQEWGIYFEYCTVELPIIQIRSFKVISSDDGEVVTPKKWKDVPFQIPNCEFSEVLTLHQE
ncbi:hypothetical protein CHS0354_014166 [Potamilus streckersoni]|uniref:RNA helicase n=1 Tax=Potamilus streckersoni TaxID=2493646 RepID=A0AAE0SMP0_9BIVA|nr:hypothetical protein CHS0354_014166 [Potamilus streckersoni]